MNTNLRALLEKDEMFGVLGLFEHNGDYLLTSQDSRTRQPAVVVNKSYQSSRKAFDEAVAQSRERGWSVIYYGKPNYG